VLDAPDGGWVIDYGGSELEILPAFGAALACGDVSGDAVDDLLVGAYDGDRDRGRVWMYPGAVGALPTTPAWALTGARADTGFGWSLAWLGDVDGDGIGDFAVGGAGADDGDVAQVFAGGGAPVEPRWTMDLGPGRTERVWAAGDLDGDGLLVSCTQTATVQLFRGARGGLSTSPDWEHQGSQLRSGYGTWVAALGDLDGDGFGDLGVGAPEWKDTKVAEGAVFLFRGAATGVEDEPAAAIFGGAPQTLLTAVVSVGDVDGDSVPELAVSAASPLVHEVRVYAVVPTSVPPDEPSDTGDPVDDTGAADTAAPVTDPGDPTPDPVPDRDAGTGCGCRTPGPTSAAWWALTACVLLRRRARS
jgi:hypothetical protein